MEPFISRATDEEIKEEKIKARALRKSQWWKRKCAKGICYFCGEQVSPKELTMEHVVPLIRGVNPPREMSFLPARNAIIRRNIFSLLSGRNTSKD